MVTAMSGTNSRRAVKIFLDREAAADIVCNLVIVSRFSREAHRNVLLLTHQVVL